MKVHAISITSFHLSYKTKPMATKIKVSLCLYLRSMYFPKSNNNDDEADNSKSTNNLTTTTHILKMRNSLTSPSYFCQ